MFSDDTLLQKDTKVYLDMEITFALSRHIEDLSTVHMTRHRIIALKKLHNQIQLWFKLKRYLYTYIYNYIWYLAIGHP